MYLKGHVGQVLGPFSANQDLLEEGGAIYEFVKSKGGILPVTIEKIGIQTEINTLIKVNDSVIKIGKTGIYELDNTVTIRSLSFLSEVDGNTIVDFVY